MYFRRTIPCGDQEFSGPPFVQPVHKFIPHAPSGSCHNGKFIRAKFKGDFGCNLNWISSVRVEIIQHNFTPMFPRSHQIKSTIQVAHRERMMGYQPEVSGEKVSNYLLADGKHCLRVFSHHSVHVNCMKADIASEREKIYRAFVINIDFADFTHPSSWSESLKTQTLMLFCQRVQHNINPVT